MEEDKLRPGESEKYIFGMVKMGEKGQIVIPAEARKVFGFKPGDMLLILGDSAQGLAIPLKENVKKFNEILSGVTTYPVTKRFDDGETDNKENK